MLNTILELVLAAIPLVSVLIIDIFFSEIKPFIHGIVAIQFFCCFVLLGRRLKKGMLAYQPARLAFLGGFLLWYAYPAFIDIIYPSYMSPQFSDLFNDKLKLRSMSFMAAFMFFGLLAELLSSTLRGKRKPKPTIEVWSSSRTIVRGSLIFCGIGLIPYPLLGGSLTAVVQGILQSRASAKPWLPLSNLGTQTSAILFLASCALVAGTSMLWLTTCDARLSVKTRISLGFLAIILTCIIFFDQGTRSVIGLILLPVIGLIFTRRNQRKRVLKILVCAGLGITMILLLQFQVLYRSAFTRSDLSSNFFIRILTLDRNIDYYQETLLAVALVPAYHDFFRESVLFQFFTSPIPRFIWPAKPSARLVWFYSLFRWNVDIDETGGNVFPGIIGQFYMSWGWGGPIIAGILMGWLAASIGHWFFRFSPGGDDYLAGVGFMAIVWYFICFRNFGASFFYPIIFALSITILSRQKVRIESGNVSYGRYSGTIVP
jgi:oligosaccharide repeat unit polymerase